MDVYGEVKLLCKFKKKKKLGGGGGGGGGRVRGGGSGCWRDQGGWDRRIEAFVRGLGWVRGVGGGGGGVRSGIGVGEVGVARFGVGG